MAEPLAYLNEKWIPESAAVVSVTDVGFLWGATVAERLRTFRGQLFRLEQHLHRLRHSLDLVGLRLPISLDALGEAAQELARHNHGLLDPDDDLGLSLFVTPGVAGHPDRPTIGMHTTPLPFEQWADEYERGVPLVMSSVRHLPPECLPPELKCRSRMHYYLAEREASAKHPHARALLLDSELHVTETPTANVLVHRGDEGLVAPRIDKVLPGTSIAVLEELAAQLGLPWCYRDISPDELQEADEIMLTSTSPCLLPVASVEGIAVRNRHPGPLFSRLLAAWSERVGVDIAAQAKRFAQRESR